jgi:hypothetical protein
MCCYQETEYTDTYDVSDYKNTSSIQNGAQMKLFHMCHACAEGEYSCSSTQSQHQYISPYHDPESTQTKSHTVRFVILNGSLHHKSLTVTLVTF